MMLSHEKYIYPLNQLKGPTISASLYIKHMERKRGTIVSASRDIPLIKAPPDVGNYFVSNAALYPTFSLIV